MAPILEQFTTFVGEVVDQLPVVRSQPGKQRHVVRSHDHVDRIELKQPNSPEGATNVTYIDSTLGSGIGKSLGRQGDPSRLMNGQCRHDRGR